MNKFLIGMSGAALAVLAAGCGPKLAQVSAGADDQEWKDFAAANYSGYRPPRVTSPAEKDKYQGVVNPAGAAADPAPAVEDPVEESPKTVVEEVPAAPAEAKKESKEEVITEAAPEKAPETPAVKEETPAADGEKKAEENKAEAAPAEESAVEGETYVVKPGDTLSGIAKQFYKDGNMSGILFKANSKVLKNPNALRPGMKLTIPKM